jgi:beta-hydroxylase
VVKFSTKAAKRIIPLVLAVYFVPGFFAIYIGFGLLDFLRNKRRTLGTLDRYFAGNGFFTWLLSPFNLLMDVLSLPYWNRGIYQLSDLPGPYQDEINAMIDAARRSDLVTKLNAKMQGTKRGMIFFKWYGKNLQAPVDVPEFHRDYRYIRTIGVSVFNTKQSTGKHFGPLRVTLRVLYNINEIASDQVYIKVGNHINYWRDNKLFIFDDTLQHQSCNESEEIRYCMFVDILRPSVVPGLTSAILACIRVAIARFNFAFYKHWAFIK